MASSSLFLSMLPAEIRNTIYELALTAPEPLRCFDPVFWDEYNPTNKRHYLYLRATPTDALDELAFEFDTVEYNQLKYVSKEVYAETVGLELKYNEITLRVSRKSEYATSFLLLNRWLSSIPVTKRSWIKTINITIETKSRYVEAGPEGVDTLARLTRLCNDNPSMRVKYYLPMWRTKVPTFHNRDLSKRHPIWTAPTVSDFITHAVDVYSYTRGEGFGKLYPEIDTKSTRTRQNWRPYRWLRLDQLVHLADLQAKNLTYFPSVPKGTELPIIKKDITWAAHGEAVPEAEQWIGYKHAKDWVENGI
ncbi:hypothetical protein AG0111_0g7843 [Alternaria gaisen]|uniref:Uncharacterized protein n=1 Tax=Alternaria gaisen TaxID=167740 RepID=A0ACB6FIM5_9PLEO|nr:hypothetical protein AG0111_0g7843 [Alternaria gaisen]